MQQITLVMEYGLDGYIIGQLKEFPAVISQGETKEEVIENIQDALELYLDDLRSEFYTEKVIEESLEREEQPLYSLRP